MTKHHGGSAGFFYSICDSGAVIKCYFKGVSVKIASPRYNILTKQNFMNSFIFGGELIQLMENM